MVVAAQRTLESRAIAEVVRMLSEDWSWLPGVASTELLSTVFAALAREGASLVHYLATRHAGFPFRMFLLLSHPSLEVATFIASTKRCCLDSWSESFLQDYHFNPQELLGEECLARLRSIATVLRCEMVSTERKHAHNQRAARMRAANNGPPLELKDLSAWHALKEQQSARKVSKAHNVPREHERPQKKRRRTNTFQAFLSVNGRSAEQLPCKTWNHDHYQGLLGRYHTLTPEERLEYQRVSDTMTAIRFGEQKQKRHRPRMERCAPPSSALPLVALPAVVAQRSKEAEGAVRRRLLEVAPPHT